MPTWLHFRFKFRPRRLQDAFNTPQGAPSWCPRRPKNRPRGTQDASGSAQELSKRCPGSGPHAPWGEDTPKNSPGPPPDFDFAAFWLRFWDYIGWIFGKDFGRLLTPIGSIFSQPSACGVGVLPPPPPRPPPLLRGTHGGGNAALLFAKPGFD